MGNKQTKQSTGWALFKEKITRREPNDRTVQFLVSLFSHTHSIEEFAKLPLCAADPLLRNDLEFYIPQFINYILCEYSEEIEETIKILSFACRESICFAHKVVWLLASNKSLEVSSEASDLQKLIEVVSKDSCWVPGTGGDSARTRQIIQGYTELHTTIFSQIQERDIPLEPFPHFGVKDGFMSTLWFIDSLSQMAGKVLKSCHRATVLQEEIKKLNLLLPAQVYIPFSSLNCQGFIVLHVPPSETKVFETKDRAPCLLAVELFNPTEEALLGQSEDEESSASKSISINTESQRRESDMADYIRDELNSIQIRHSLYVKPLRLKRQTPPRETVASVYNSEHNQGLKLETFSKQALRIRNRSPFGNLKTWRLLRVIVKAGDELLQEQLAMQLIFKIRQIFYESELELWLKPYEILAVSPSCGLVECINDAYSIDAIKKSLPVYMHSLLDYFRKKYGPADCKRFKQARDNFIKSLAAYSLVCYILQIKDRNNGNILIDSEGHILHIDFGFILNHSPGGWIKFENVPFKLTNEFIEIIGGVQSWQFQRFRKLCANGFLALRRKAEELILLVEMMKNGIGAALPCYFDGDQAVQGLRERLSPESSEKESKRRINRLINESLDHWRTKWYDRYQFCCQNIFY